MQWTPPRPTTAAGNTLGMVPPVGNQAGWVPPVGMHPGWIPPIGTFPNQFQFPTMPGMIFPGGPGQVRPVLPAVSMNQMIPPTQAHHTISKGPVLNTVKLLLLFSSKN